MGMLAKMARRRFPIGERKARLCEISWMARKRFWLLVAPITYAVRRKRHESMEVSRRRYAQQTWSETTPSTTYLVKGSGPQSLVTCFYERVVRDDSIGDGDGIEMEEKSRSITTRTGDEGRTSGWALIIACRLERCGSSVYVQKNWSSTIDSGGATLVDGCCC